jgi:transcriptional regulator of NAD metabolism
VRQLASPQVRGSEDDIGNENLDPKDVICQDISMIRGILMPLIATTRVPRVNLFVDT